MAVLAKAVLISRNVHCFLYNTAVKIVRRDIGQPMDRNVTDLDADLETGRFTILHTAQKIWCSI